MPKDQLFRRLQNKQINLNISSDTLNSDILRLVGNINHQIANREISDSSDFDGMPKEHMRLSIPDIMAKSPSSQKKSLKKGSQKQRKSASNVSNVKIENIVETSDSESSSASSKISPINSPRKTPKSTSRNKSPRQAKTPHNMLDSKSDNLEDSTDSDSRSASSKISPINSPRKTPKSTSRRKSLRPAETPHNMSDSESDNLEDSTATGDLSMAKFSPLRTPGITLKINHNISDSNCGNSSSNEELSEAPPDIPTPTKLSFDGSASSSSSEEEESRVMLTQEQRRLDDFVEKTQSIVPPTPTHAGRAYDHSTVWAESLKDSDVFLCRLPTEFDMSMLDDQHAMEGSCISFRSPATVKSHWSGVSMQCEVHMVKDDKLQEKMTLLAPNKKTKVLEPGPPLVGHMWVTHSPVLPACPLPAPRAPYGMTIPKGLKYRLKPFGLGGLATDSETSACCNKRKKDNKHYIKEEADIKEEPSLKKRKKHKKHKHSET